MAPKTVSELRSLLGLANYCQRLIPNFSTIVAPLNMLTKKDVKFEWSNSQEQAFKELKKAIATQAMAYYDPSKRTQVIVDASPVGLGAVMMQNPPNEPNNKQIVLFASRSLTPIRIYRY